MELALGQDNGRNWEWRYGEGAPFRSCSTAQSAPLGGVFNAIAFGVGVFIFNVKILE